MKKFPFKDITIEPAQPKEKQEAQAQDKNHISKIVKQLGDDTHKGKKAQLESAKTTTEQLKRRMSIENEVKETFRNKRLEKMYRK